MNALEVHGEHEFLEWIETLRKGQIDVNDLRVEADEWLIWLDRRFDRRAANERLGFVAVRARWRTNGRISRIAYVASE
jgi:hypothetical protein